MDAASTLRCEAEDTVAVDGCTEQEELTSFGLTRLWLVSPAEIGGWIKLQEAIAPKA